MPLYQYCCFDCGVREQRLAGVDDEIVLCVRCSGLMVRQEEDAFKNLEPDAEERHDQ